MTRFIRIALLCMALRCAAPAVTFVGNFAGDFSADNSGGGDEIRYSQFSPARQTEQVALLLDGSNARESLLAQGPAVDLSITSADTPTAAPEPEFRGMILAGFCLILLVRPRAWKLRRE